MEESPETGARAAGLPPHVIETLKWLVTTLGITGILVILGFIDEFAYQDRLGYEFKTGDLSGYSVEGGRFLLAMLLAALTWVAEHYLITIAAAVVLFGTGLAIRRIPGDSLRIGTKLGAIAALLAVNLVIFDLPTVGLQQALILPVSPPQNAAMAWPIGTLTQRVWEHEVCSRIDKSQFPLFEAMGGKCRERLPETHERIRKDRFALNILVTLTLVFLFISTLQQARDLPKSLPVMIAVIVLVFLNILMLPYVYAKTDRSTFADSVKVNWADAAAEAQLGTNNDFFLLYQRGGEVALLEKNDGLIWKVPEKQVRLFLIVDRVDVYSFLAKKHLVPTREAPPP
jgi:hypothetical protein